MKERKKRMFIRKKQTKIARKIAHMAKKTREYIIRDDFEATSILILNVTVAVFEKIYELRNTTYLLN